MKKKTLVFLVMIVLLCGGFFPLNPAGAEEGLSQKVVAYYFYGAMRCSTCHRLQQYSQEALEVNFKDELASGRLEFRAINVEEKGNEHYIKEYQLYTKSLVLSLVKDGQQIKWVNLNKIWEYAGNKQEFFNYVKNEVTDLLKESP